MQDTAQIKLSNLNVTFEESNIIKLNKITIFRSKSNNIKFYNFNHQVKSNQIMKLIFNIQMQFGPSQYTLQICSNDMNLKKESSNQIKYQNVMQQFLLKSNQMFSYHSNGQVKSNQFFIIFKK